MTSHGGQWHSTGSVPLTALGTSRIPTAFPILRRPETAGGTRRRDGERISGVAAPAMTQISPRRYSPVFSAARKADWGISTLPNWRIFFFPFFCFSRSFFLRVMSPP